MERRTTTSQDRCKETLGTGTGRFEVHEVFAAGPSSFGPQSAEMGKDDRSSKEAQVPSQRGV